MSDPDWTDVIVPEGPNLLDRVFRFVWFNPVKTLAAICALVCGLPFIAGLYAGWMMFS